MKLRVRLSTALAGVILSLLVVSTYEWAFEADATPMVSLIFQDLRLAVLAYKNKKYSVKAWLKRALAAVPSNKSFQELQVIVIKRT